MLELSYLSMLVCGGLLVWIAMGWAMQPQPAVRLPKSLNPPQTGTGFAAGAPRHHLAPLLGLAGRLLPRWGRSQAQTEHALYPGATITVTEFQGIRMLLALAACFIALVVMQEFGGIQPLWVVLAAALGFIAPGLWLNARLAQRKQAVVRRLPEVIDLLSLCVGAGLDFLGALQKVVLLRGSSKREPLIDELGFVIQEINIGQRKIDALKAMAKRVNVPELSSFIRTLVQGERMGTPLSEVLTVHAEDLRFIRYAIAERAALKAPIKILIPLIFCIMPCVALIVGGPIFIQFMKQSPFGR